MLLFGMTPSYFWSVTNKKSPITFRQPGHPVDREKQSKKKPGVRREFWTRGFPPLSHGRFGFIETLCNDDL
jgi:hypothetical protein